MMDLKMKELKGRTESVVLNYICNLEFVPEALQVERWRS